MERLAARGLEARIVSERLNRRKIDLIPRPEWADPPKAQIDSLLRAVEARLAAAGIAGLPAVAAIAAAAARDAGLPEPRITSDAKHVEIGLTDKADSGRAAASPSSGTTASRPSSCSSAATSSATSGACPAATR